jgi:hypothetical protein
MIYVRDACENCQDGTTKHNSQLNLDTIQAWPEPVKALDDVHVIVFVSLSSASAFTCWTL